MSLNRPRPEQIWLLLAAVVLIVLIASAITFTLRVHGQASGALDQIEPRYARISGLLQKQEQISQASKALSDSLTQYVYSAGGDASQIGNQVLQKVRDLATARDLRVTSSQSQPARADNDHPGLDRIAIDLRIEGDWSALQGLLTDLARQTPAIYQNTVQLNTQASGRYFNPNANNNAPLIVGGQFDLYVLQEHPGGAAAPAQPGASAPGKLLSGAAPKPGARGAAS